MSLQPSLGGRRSFLNAGLGEVYGDETAGLSCDVLLSNRRQDGWDDYQGQSCDTGVDVGRLSYVVIREHVEERDTEHPSTPPHAPAPNCSTIRNWPPSAASWHKTGPTSA